MTIVRTIAATLAVTAGTAGAATTYTATTGGFDFYVGTRKAAVVDTLEACVQAARDDAEVMKKDRTYRCLQTTQVAVAYAPAAWEVSQWSAWTTVHAMACTDGSQILHQERVRSVIVEGEGAAPVLQETRAIAEACAAEEPGEHDGHPSWSHPEPPPRDETNAHTILRIQPTSNRGYDAYDGAFRIPCAYSHMNFDDPIIVPRQPGAFHLHMYFGNTTTDAFTTTESLDEGASTCAGGIANRTAYWTPAMIDASGVAVLPASSLWYYKGAGDSAYSADIQPLPRGLRLVTGKDHRASAPEPDWKWTQRVSFNCLEGGSEDSSETIPACPSGSLLEVHVEFPPCWDGVNLDSADHRSHMTTIGGNGRCPSSHPVHLPKLTMNMGYRIPASQTSEHWRLSSDNYDRSQPGGYSLHADVWFDWDASVMGTWLDHCVRANRDCEAYLLGDGSMVY